MDLNEQIKGLLLGQAQPGSFTDKAGLALSQAGNTLAQDAGAGAAILNDPRNAWIGMNPLGRAAAGGLGLGSALLGQIAYHGSPHLFEKFAMSKIGTGEGNQAFGYGLYLAEKPEVANSYRRGLSAPGKPLPKDVLQAIKDDDLLGYESVRDLMADIRKMPNWDKVMGASPKTAEVVNKYLDSNGVLYKVDVPDEAVGMMLEWEKPLSAHSQDVQDVITKAWPHVGNPKSSLNPFPGDTGTNLYYKLVELTGSEQAASQKLKEMGIPGIKYLDALSRDGAGAGTRNYVVFDDQLPVIKERNGLELAK